MIDCDADLTFSAYVIHRVIRTLRTTKDNVAHVENGL